MFKQGCSAVLPTCNVGRGRSPAKAQVLTKPAAACQQRYRRNVSEAPPHGALCALQRLAGDERSAPEGFSKCRRGICSVGLSDPGCNQKSWIQYHCQRAAHSKCHDPRAGAAAAPSTTALLLSPSMYLDFNALVLGILLYSASKLQLLMVCWSTRQLLFGTPP